eukprot:g77259.t1
MDWPANEENVVCHPARLSWEICTLSPGICGSVRTNKPQNQWLHTEEDFAVSGPDVDETFPLAQWARVEQGSRTPVVSKNAILPALSGNSARFSAETEWPARFKIATRPK